MRSIVLAFSSLLALSVVACSGPAPEGEPETIKVSEDHVNQAQRVAIDLTRPRIVYEISVPSKSMKRVAVETATGEISLPDYVGGIHPSAATAVSSMPSGGKVLVAATGKDLVKTLAPTGSVASTPKVNAAAVSSGEGKASVDVAASETKVDLTNDVSKTHVANGASSVTSSDLSCTAAACECASATTCESMLVNVCLGETVCVDDPVKGLRCFCSSK